MRRRGKGCVKGCRDGSKAATLLGNMRIFLPASLCRECEDKDEGESKSAASKMREASGIILAPEVGRKQWELQGACGGRGVRIWHRGGGLRGRAVVWARGAKQKV